MPGNGRVPRQGPGMRQEPGKVYKEPGRGRSFGWNMRLGGCKSLGGKRRRWDIDLGGDSSMLGD